MTEDFDTLYGSKYLSAADLNGTAKRATIDKVAVADFNQKDGSSRRKLVLTLAGVGKTLVVNRTNAGTLAQAFGKAWADWPGNTIEVYSTPTPVGEGIPVRPLRRTAAPVQPGDELSNNVPF
jgi:hypothetical protein